MTVLAHPLAVRPLEEGDQLKTYAVIEAQGIHLEMPPVKTDRGGVRVSVAPVPAP